MSHKKLILYLDCGDTIIDEATEVRDKNDIVLTADLIPGADTMIKELFTQGFKLVLVADGYAQSFKNMLSQHQLYDYFSTYIYSEHLKVCKPDQRMFLTAHASIALKQSDYCRTAMVGNNLARDIRGANQMGMISIWLNWAPRRSKKPADKLEVPDYTIKKPIELIELANQINARL